MTFETERLILREYTFSDWKAVHEYGSDPAVCLYMPWGPNTMGETQAFVRRAIEYSYEMPRREYELAIILKEENKLIGGCGLSVSHPEHFKAMLGYCLHRDYWGKGYAAEASRVMVDYGFQTLNLNRIYAWCHAANTASARVMEKVGMIREGLMRKNHSFKGEWWDDLMYAILREEWEKAASL